MSKPGKFLVLFAAVFVLSALPLCQTTDMESQLNARLKDKVIRLKTPAIGDKLEFSDQGKLVTANRGLRGADDLVQVSRVRLNGGEMIVEGKRALQMYDLKQQSSTFGITSYPVSVQIKFATPSSTEDELVSGYLSVFFGKDDQSQVCPAEQLDTWRLAVATPTHRKPQRIGPAALGCLPTGASGWVIGKDVKVPKIRVPAPEYTESARKSRLQGGCVFGLRVDEMGDVTDAVLLSTDKADFAMSTIRALRKWKLRPAEKGAEAVPVLVRFEVNFRLY